MNRIFVRLSWALVQIWKTFRRGDRVLLPDCITITLATGTGPPVPMTSASLCSRGLGGGMGKRRFTRCRAPCSVALVGVGSAAGLPVGSLSRTFACASATP
jgi:hypothetical protein